MKFIRPLINLFKLHKTKLLFTFGATFLFLVIFFPREDLSAFISSSINKLTNNSIIIIFEDINFDVIPSPKIKFQKVRLSTPLVQGLETERLTVSPSIISLLSLKPGASVYLDGFFNGEAKAHFTSTLPSEDGQEVFLDLDLISIDIDKLTSMVDLPASFSGKLDLSVKGNVDTTIKEQPNFAIAFKLDRAGITNISIPTAIGPLTLPNITLNSVVSQLTLDKGKLQITSMKVDNRSSIYGDVTGTVELELKNTRRGIAPQIGVYDLKFNLGLSPSLEQELKVYLNTLGLAKYKQNGIYRFTANGTPYGMPSIRGM